MSFETRYANGAMLPDRRRLQGARYVRRHPTTGEISWPPSDTELELMELALIPRATTEEN